MSNKLSMPSLTSISHISVGARKSPLSQAQVQEIENEIQTLFPEIQLSPIFLDTIGDLDQQSSLRTLEKTDFFTKEIDQLLLEKKCRIAVHSAKDLPDPIPEGLKIIAVTKGVDPTDVLVLRQGDSLESLLPGSKIATSSERREQAAKKLRTDFTFIDLRGNIGQRLEKLHKGEADGVIIAEAALIRLGLTHLNRTRLPGETVPCQGQLAIVSRSNDTEMIEIFSKLDSRKTTLHVGLEPPKEDATRKHIHHPVIRIIPRNAEHPEIKKTFDQLSDFTHLIFTSQSTVKIFFKFLTHFNIPITILKNRTILAVGKKTAKKIDDFGAVVYNVPTEETSEGIVDLLSTHNLDNANILWPHSALSRDVIPNFLKQNNLRYQDVIFYETVPQSPGPLPHENEYEQILFTSPSTIHAFFQLYEKIPNNKQLSTIGPITKKYLDRILRDLR